MNEAEWKKQFTDLAELLGWEWVHFRPCQERGQWTTPVDGPLGVGWPDVVLVHDRMRRMIITELKTDVGKLKPDQKRIIDWLTEVFMYPGSNVGVYVWRPRDFDTIRRVLS